MSQDVDRARKEFWEKLDDSPFVMVSLQDEDAHAAPMTAILDKGADHQFWFYTTRDNRLASGGAAMVHFASKGHDLFACVSGTLVGETDPEIIKRYWNNAVEAWYEGGRDDPNLLMLRFELGDAEIWEADPGIKGSFKLLTGMTMKPGDAGEHVRTAL